MSSSLRIGIACYPTLGGSGVVATELAGALAELGHCVHMFTYATPHRPAHGVRLHLVDVVAYPLMRFPPYDLALASQIVDIIQNEAPLDILHVHYAVPHAISAFLAKQMIRCSRFSTITTLHGTDISIVGSDPAYASVTRFGIEESDGVTAVSESLKDDTIARLGVKKPIRVIPNFVDSDFFRPNPDRKPTDFRIAHASNFRAVKRPLDVIRVFARVLREIPARLSLIGEGPELPNALELARELKVIHSIDVFGAIPAPNVELAMADAFLLPSETESFGLSALEAMACGVPVVASRVGGIPEVVTHGSNGFLHPVGDVDGMAGSLLQIARNSKMHLEMGRNARDVATTKFTKTRIVHDYVEFYRSILALKNC